MLHAIDRKNINLQTENVQELLNEREKMIMEEIRNDRGLKK